jgi:hypothetical protein
MINTTIHYKSNGTQRHKMPCLPRPGDYLADAARLWRVDSILFNPTPQVYAVQVAEIRRDELEQSWATWCESTATDAQDEM